MYIIVCIIDYDPDDINADDINPEDIEDSDFVDINEDSRT